MSYTPVPTKTTGELWSADDNNTYIRDNFAAGVPDLFTTKGDLAVATGADVAIRLAVGTDGQLLTADSGETCGMKWSTPSTDQAYAKYKVSATRSMANGAATIVNFDTSVFDSDSAVTTGASWKFAAPHDGYYVVALMLLLESNAGWAANEYFEGDLYVDGALVTTIARWTAQAAGTYIASVSGMAIVSLTAAQEVDIRGLQNSGGAINIDADGNYSHVAIAKLF